MDKQVSDKSDKVLPILMFGFLLIAGAYGLFISFRDKKPQQPNLPAVIKNR